jgi:hypothetical protein
MSDPNLKNYIEFVKNHPGTTHIPGWNAYGYTEEEQQNVRTIRFVLRELLANDPFAEEPESPIEIDNKHIGLLLEYIVDMLEV